MISEVPFIRNDCDSNLKQMLDYTNFGKGCLKKKDRKTCAQLDKILLPRIRATNS